MDEVENSVRSGARAVDEVGPGDRTLRRGGGAQIAEAAGRPKPCEIGQEAFAHHAFGETRIHTVHAEHDDLFAGGPRYAIDAAEPNPGGAETDRADRRGGLENGSATRSYPDWLVHR